LTALEGRIKSEGSGKRELFTIPACLSFSLLG
jgi:hypothetical protein